jgi:hypothetical protein
MCAPASTRSRLPQTAKARGMQKSLRVGTREHRIRGRRRAWGARRDSAHDSGARCRGSPSPPARMRFWRGTTRPLPIEPRDLAVEPLASRADSPLSPEHDDLVLARRHDASIQAPLMGEVAGLKSRPPRQSPDAASWQLEKLTYGAKPIASQTPIAGLPANAAPTPIGAIQHGDGREGRAPTRGARCCGRRALHAIR